MLAKFAWITPKPQYLTPPVSGFGSLDIETYCEAGKDIFKVYCVVGYFNSNYFSAYYGESYTTVFKRKKVVITDPICIVLFKLLKYMKGEKLKSVILYAHNLSSFDGYFILKSCASHGLNLSVLKRESKIYFVKVKVGRYQIEFRCSLLLLQAGLNDCAKAFDIQMIKAPFNHNWVTKDRLFYTGKTPDGFWWDAPGTHQHCPFVFKDYALEYCKMDCKILYEVLLVFDREVRAFGVSLATKSYSIPGFAFRVFRNKYLKFNCLVNLSRHKNIDDFIRRGYYGGRSEVFRSYIGGNKGYYYDVKGMYAEAMKESLPCGEAIRTTQFSDGWLNEEIYKGFYMVSVDAPKMDMPVLPYRNEEGKLLFPWGNWTGIYYSEELLLAKSMGYKFKPIEAIIFKESKPFLKEYVEGFTKIKERGGVYRAIGKLFINSLYGRFGLNPADELTIVIPKERESYYSHRFKIIDREEIGSNLLLTYSPKPVLEFYKENNLFPEYKKDQLSYRKRNSLFLETNVGVAAAISSLGRVRLYKDMVSVTQNGGKIAYCDTDSIFAEFEESPLGKQHGNVYWDPNNPLTRFEEGVFLAPKMYSIKNLQSRVKGVKLGFASHDKFLDALKSKARSMDFDSLSQFYRDGFDIVLRGVDKRYSLWGEDKREWYKDEEGVWATRTKKINGNMKILGDTPQEIFVGSARNPPSSAVALTETDYFTKLNRVVKHSAYQALGSDLEIVVEKGDIIISAPVRMERPDLLYYAVMSKLHLPVNPKFMKILYRTAEGGYYTISRYIYSPHIHFILPLNVFIDFVKTLSIKTEEKYKINQSGWIIFRIVFNEEDRLKVTQHEMVYPIPPAVEQKVLLRDLEDIERLRGLYEERVSRLDRALGRGKERGLRIEDIYLSDTKYIVTALKWEIGSISVIDRLIPSSDERVNIKDSLIASLIESKIKFQVPSLQKVLGIFLNKVGILNKDTFNIYLRAAILLIRALSFNKLITLNKTGRSSPYLIDCYEANNRDILKREFYADKIFFSKEEYKEEKSEIRKDLRSIELTPVSLRHEYFQEIKEIIRGIEEGKLSREVYGFSLEDQSFRGELLTINEGLKHYEYISGEMKRLNKDYFYYYWFADYRGRMYPKLSAFSIQSSRILRAGFMNKSSPLNMFTKEEIFLDMHYREYLVRLLKKHVWKMEWTEDPSKNFNMAIELLKSFEINGSKDHYEIMVRKIELDLLTKRGVAQISPIPLDGQCNVYQHISALTKDNFIAPFVNTTLTNETKDLYIWFKEKLIEELECKKEVEYYAGFLLDMKDKGLDIRALIKHPIMTFPYGSTSYNVREHVRSIFKRYIKSVEWDIVKYIADKIIRIRKENLSRVENLQNFFREIIKDCEIVRWVLPDDFLVQQKYFETKEVKISTSFRGREMTTSMLYREDTINKREHLQSITANLIHSLDAYHLRRIIKTTQQFQIPLLLIHDCIMVDTVHIKPVKEIIRDEFNKIYKDPERLLKNIYLSIIRHNPEMRENEEVYKKIKSLMGTAKISATKDLFK